MAHFNIWSANVGVFAKGHRSLDFRLKDISEIYVLVTLLLSALEEDLLGK